MLNLRRSTRWTSLFVMFLLLTVALSSLATTAFPLLAAPAAQSGAGTGLRAELFNTVDLTGSSISRVDPAVDFDWQWASPDPLINTDNFSIRWTGRVEAPVSGSYTFSTLSDDGVRLWVNNQQLINNWTDQGPAENSGTITLTAGQRYDLRLEYYDGCCAATIKLRWAYPGQAQQIVPATRLSLPANYVALKARFFPRDGEAARMLNGTFQGSNTSSTAGFVDLGRSRASPRRIAGVNWRWSHPQSIATCATAAPTAGIATSLSWSFIGMASV